MGKDRVLVVLAYKVTIIMRFDGEKTGFLLMR